MKMIKTLSAAIALALFALASCVQPADNTAGGGNTQTPQTTYTVSFNPAGGTPAPASQTVNAGGTVTQPPAMTKSGHTFDGWYKEANYTTPWNFTTDTVNANITLHAKWNAETG